jgi:flavin-dependent dehydrogenase
MYAHFIGARRETGKREGNIGIFWFDHGWFWFIPLADGNTSIGAVVWPSYMKTRSVDLPEFFMSTIALCPPLAERLADATLSSEVEATGNYSYTSDRTHGANYLLVGDAYAFVDPVFSTGVMMAMTSAAAAAETIEECFIHPARAARAMKRYDRLLRHGPKHFSWFIYRVTNPAMRELFLGPRNLLRMKEALLSVLAGDIYGRTPIWGPLRAFKGVYYAMSFANLGRSWRAARRRALNIRPVEAESSTGG